MEPAPPRLDCASSRDTAIEYGLDCRAKDPPSGSGLTPAQFHDVEVRLQVLRVTGHFSARASSPAALRG
jgi:hypothetical protein